MVGLMGEEEEFLGYGLRSFELFERLSVDEAGDGGW